MNFIINKEEYLKLAAAWKTIPARTAEDHILYNVLRGFDLKRGFSPIQKQSKLSNGFTEWQAFDKAKREAYWTLREPTIYAGESAVRTATRALELADRIKWLNKKFGITFTSELMKTLRELLA
jgi:hypothetical protein